MKNKSYKNKLIFKLLLPLCKDTLGNFDKQKTADCKKMITNTGTFAMGLGTILLLVGFAGLVIKQKALGIDVLWFWVAVGFGTLFTCLGISAINTGTSIQTYVNEQLSPKENEQE